MARIWERIERRFGGHVSLGPVTIYGANAMHWAVNIRTRRWGYICFRLPLPCFGYFWPLYFYLSPNATPWASTFMLGGGRDDRGDRLLAPERRRRFGHGFDCEAHYDELSTINDPPYSPAEQRSATV